MGPEEEAFRRPKRKIEPEKKPLIEYQPVEEAPGEVPEPPFFVKEIIVEGETHLPPWEVKNILARYQNQSLTLPQLRGAAQALTLRIRSEGYVTSRVYIPPQKIDEGRVRFRVLEGKLGKVSIRGNRRFKERFIQQQITTRAGEALRYHPLEQDLLRLNTHPDREVRAILIPGEIPETSDLILEVKESYPVHLGYSFDNFGTRLTGRLRHGVTLSHSNFLGRDDILQSRFLITDGGHFVGAAADYLLPLGASTDLVFDYVFVDTRLGGAFNDLKIRGEAHVFSTTFLQRVMDYESWEGSLFLGFDFKEIKTEEDRVLNSKDSLRILRLGPQLVERDGGGRTFFTSEFAFGFDGFMGASHKVDSGSSRKEAGGQFFRSVIEAGRLQRLFWGSFLLLRGALHLTPDKLPASEQMRVGGAETVRGYPEGDFLGERGFNFNTELRFPCFFIPQDWKYPKIGVAVRDSIQWVGFFDLARVETKGTPQNQASQRTLVGLGGGIRFNLNRKILGRNISARLDWGYPVGEAPVTEKRSDRFHFSLSLTL